MRNPFKLLLPLFALATHGQAGPWNLTWSDEFNGPANTSIDGSKWSFDTGGGGYGNGELETYTNRTQNVRMDGAGHLVIEARAENYTGTDGINRNYTSGRFHSNGKFSQAYGRFEASIKIPYGQGIWPAFWTMGNNIGAVGWPSCGEIDIMENVGFEPNVVHGTIHGPGYSGGSGIGLGYNDGSALANGYHLYAIEWEPNVVRWYIDNVLYEVRSTADIPGGSTWVYDHPFFILFNLAVGGAWPGNPDGSTVFSQFMLVDYVRVYSKDTTQTPYSAQNIPGTVECEDYDHGGEGVAFHDTTPPNLGGTTAPRADENVDLEPCTDAGGGSDLGWTVAGEWLEYTVNIASSGTYAFTARVASQGAGGNFHLQADSVDVPGSGLSVPDTGGWQSWQTIGPVNINLPAGTHVIQLYMDSNGGTGGIGNFNWLHFTSLTTPTFTPTRTAQPTNTRTVTATSTRTATPQASFTATSTRTAVSTFSNTVTPSATFTRTSTRTVTLSSTPSSTASSTRTVTLSASPSRSPSPSPSATVSPSVSMTGTDVPVGSTATNTPTVTPSFSASPTNSATASPSRTSSPSPSLSPTGTLTLTESPSSTATASPPPQDSATPTATNTVGLSSLTPSSTASPSMTPTATGTASPSASASASMSSTPTSTLTVTAIPATPMPATATSSPSPTSTLPTPITGGRGHILRVESIPNPCSGPALRLALNFDGAADEAEIRLYTSAMTCVLHERLQGPFPLGWSQASVDISRLPGGLYFLQSGRAMNRVLVLR